MNPNTLKQSLPELPWEKRERLTKLGLKPEDVEVFVRNRNWGDYFEAVSKTLENEPKKVLLSVNYITSDLAGLIKKDETSSFDSLVISDKVPVSTMTGIAEIIVEGLISSAGANTFSYLYQKQTHVHLLMNSVLYRKVTKVN